MWFRKLLYMQKEHTFVPHLHNKIIYTHTAKADTCELSVTIVLLNTLAFHYRKYKTIKVYQTKSLPHHSWLFWLYMHICVTCLHNNHHTIDLPQWHCMHLLAHIVMAMSTLFYCYTWLRGTQLFTLCHYCLCTFSASNVTFLLQTS